MFESRINTWIIIVVVGIICLYPLQKIIDNRSTDQFITLKNEKTNGFSSYLINQPDTTFLLPTTLDEISGLSLSHHVDQLVAVQDEKGLLFYISKTSGELVDQVKFGGGDDYEGVELADSQVYVVNSKGDFDIVNVYRPEVPKITMKTFLNSSDDVEGLGRLHDENSLLVACKAARRKSDKNRKIFRLDLDEMELDSVPFASLDNEAISEALGKERVTPFRPSGVTVDPRSGEIYVVSSASRALIILNRKGKLTHAVRLDPRVHRQPEGIAMDVDGRLYISNEARDVLAKLHIFYPK